MLNLFKELGTVVFLLVAGATMGGGFVGNGIASDIIDAELACNERVIDAEIKQGEAAEHAYNVGKEEMANTILSLCNEDKKIKLDGAVLLCELVIGKEI